MPPEDAIEVLHTAKAHFKGNLRTGVVGAPQQIPGSRDAPAQDEIDHAGADFGPEETHQAARRKPGGPRDHRQGQVFAEVDLDKSDGTAQLHPGPPRFLDEALFVRMSQSIRDQFQEIQQVVLSFLRQDAVLSKEGVQRAGVYPGLDQVLARILPFGRGRSAVVHLATLEQGDRLAVANHGDDELPEAGVTAIPQGQRASPGLEKTALVAHGAQGPTGGVPGERRAKGLGSAFEFEHDHALTVG